MYTYVVAWCISNVSGRTKTANDMTALLGAKIF